MGSNQSKQLSNVDDSSKQQQKKDDATTASDASNKIETGDSKESEGGGCPMKRADGSYSYDWRALFQSPHGSGGNKPLKKEDLAQQADGSVTSKKNDSSQHQQKQQGGCPVKEYNVYSQPIDSTNNMPMVANQLPAPNQKQELSTNRVRSSISKGGASEGSTWTYPSPQMFYNALARKGKLGDTREEDMESIVAIHNNMNEKTWAKVMEWENVLDPSSTPKLLKFMGRPADLSPKAMIKHYLLGHPMPYDRHDWTVLRSDGTTVRYVIDYYHDEQRANETPESALPSKDDHEATPSLLVDVRPALDNPFRLWDRAISMPYARHIEKSTDYEILPMAPSEEMKSQVQESLEVWSQIQANARQKQERRDLKDTLTEKDAVALAKSFAQILKDCQEATGKVEACETEEECQRASLDLTICMSKIVCPLQHKSLTKAVSGDDDESVEAALERLTDCVTHNAEQRTLAKEKYPQLFDENAKE